MEADYLNRIAEEFDVDAALDLSDWWRTSLAYSTLANDLDETIEDARECGDTVREHLIADVQRRLHMIAFRLAANEQP